MIANSTNSLPAPAIANRAASSTTVVVNLGASPFFGGPEWQILELAKELVQGGYRPTMMSFAEGGGSRQFLEIAADNGFRAIGLEHDTPHLRRAVREVAGWLTRLDAQVLLCHGYKADILGRLAARRVGIPAVSVSHGWTAESRKVRVYEAIDRRLLRWMDHVVCVSAGQARKVLRTGISPHKVTVIHNAVRCERFQAATPARRAELAAMFRRPVRRIVAAAGRISPEKGFDVLLRAAAKVCEQRDDIGFVWLGDGALRGQARQSIEAAGLTDRFVLAGFRRDLDELMPCLDLLAIPSYSEGLPCVLLEAFACSVPVVATAVGGIPEALDDGQSGYLVAPGDSAAMAARVLEVLDGEERRRAMGAWGRARVERDFTFQSQFAAYDRLFQRLLDA